MMNTPTAESSIQAETPMIAQSIAASVHVGIAPVGFFVVIGLVLFLAFAVATIASALLRGRTNQTDGSNSHRGFGFGLLMILLVGGLAMLPIVGFITVRDRVEHPEVRIEENTVSGEIHESLNEMIQDLSAARSEIHQSMRGQTRQIVIAKAGESTASQESVVISAVSDPIETHSPDSNAVQATVRSQPVDSPAVPESDPVVVVDTTEAASSDSPQAAVSSDSEPPAEESRRKSEPVSQAPALSQATPETAATETPGDKAKTEPAATAAAETTSTAADEEMQKKRAELETRIGQWIRSMVPESSSAADGSDTAAQAVQSENGDVVVLQLSDEMMAQLLGEKGQEILRSFNSELPGRIRQTYALVPLTSPVDAAVTPMKPLLAAGGLRDIANSLVRMLDQADETAKSKEESTAATASAETGSQSDKTNTAAAAPETKKGELAVEPALKPMPAWIKNPEGRRLVAQTAIILPGDDSEELLLEAVNEALWQHLQNITETSDPKLHRQAAITSLELAPETARKCIVETWERREIIDSEVAGPTEARRIYALVEFPESIDTAAFEKLRSSLQIHRVAAVSGSMVLAWLAVCSFGCCVRLGRKGSRLRRLLAAPFFGLLALPLLLGGIVLLLVTVNGNPASPPFLPEMESLVIRMDSPSTVSVSR